MYNDNDFKFDPHIWLDPLLVKDQVNNNDFTFNPENTQFQQNMQTHHDTL